MKLTLASTCLALSLSLGLGGCASPPPGVNLVGTVDDTTRTVAMPNLSVPAVNLDAGFASTKTGGAGGSSNATSAANGTSSASTTAASYGFGSTWTLATVSVKEGQSVHAGQTLATLDTAALTAQLHAAQADREVSRAQLDVIETTLSDLATKADDLAAAKTSIRAAIRKLTSTLATMKKAQPQLIAARADLAAQLASARNLLAHYPPAPPPGTPTPDQLRAAIAKLSAAVAGLDAKLAQVRAAIPQLSAGLATARAAQAKLNTAGATLSDARSTVRELRSLTRIAADGAGIPVELAQVQLDRAVLRAPTDGVIIAIATAGQRLAPGAPVATIRPNTKPTITAWLSDGQRAQVCVGDHAEISGDWMPAGGGIAATLTTISPSAEYPPSSTTTDETHLTRAVKVLLTADAGLPAGVPVTIAITGCHPVAGSSNQEK